MFESVIIMATEIDVFAIASFLLLGIERVLYGYWFIYPESFKSELRKGTFGKSMKKEPLFWKSAMSMGMYVKVFQFSVVAYDIIVRSTVLEDFMISRKFALGCIMMGIGQGLNMAAFKALGGIGIYYGHEFGYDVKFVKNFPYNVTWIADPQYWGVVIFIWGIYYALNVQDYTIPICETFWYLMSMKVFEHERGKKLAHRLLGPDVKFVKV